MSRACFAFAFAVASLILIPLPAAAQTNSEKASQLSGPPPQPPAPVKAVQDSAKAARAKAKAKSRKEAEKDSVAAEKAKAAAPVSAPSPDTAVAAPAAVPGGTASAPAANAAVPGDSAADKRDSLAAAEKAPGAGAADTLAAETLEPGRPAADATAPRAEPQRVPQDLRLFNDRPLIAREYGFGILGSIVAGTLCFYIGSGLETAIVGEGKAHQGTLSFTGIRYDNFKGAFWGGSTGLILGSALTTYFTGQTDEENGGFFATLLGTTAAAAGSFYLAGLMGVNDDVDWKPFLPLLAIPSAGGTLAFNISRWFHDQEREKTVGKQASVRLRAPTLAWGFGPGGDRVELRALRMTF